MANNWAWVYVANIKGPKGDVGDLRRGFIPANTNLNTMISLSHSGVWGTSGANLNTYVNLPVVEPGALFVIISGNGSVTQQFYPYARNTLYQRVALNSGGTSWSAWVDVMAGTAPYNRGIIPVGTDLNTMISASAHSGQWGTSGSNIGTYSNLPVGETGILEVVAPGTGAVVQRYTPYAKGVTYSRSVTNITGAAWTPWLALGSGNTTAAPSAPQSDPAAPLETNEAVIEFFGDSLTEAGGVIAKLAELMPSKSIVNHGVSGQTAGQIASRQGGSPSLIAVAGDTIPASGSVAVTNRTLQFLAKTGLPARSMTGRLAGVAGTMSNTAGSTAYTFTRTTAGDAVPCPPNTPFYPDEGKNARQNFGIFWAGTNNPDTGIVDYVMAMCRYLSPVYKKFLVLTPTGSSDDVVGTTRNKLFVAAADQLVYELGPRVLDIRAWLIANGLSALGITPTEADNTAVTGNAIPPSLTTDGTHFTPAAQTLIGQQIYQKLLDLDEIYGFHA